MKQTATLSNDVRKKIKDITIKTKRLLRGSLIGDSRSAVKGTGFEFDQIREYQFGDDVRFIDWKASSRTDSLLVKQYFEERCRTILLAVDISASGILGSQDTLKRDVFAQIASVLTIVTTQGNDRVGALLFTDEIETFIPPARGPKHAHVIMNALFGYQPKRKKTNLSAVLSKLAQYKQKDAISFVISDFIDPHIDPKLLSFVSRRHELYAVRCLDEKERRLEGCGFLPVQDSETGNTYLLDTRSGRSNVSSHLQESILKQTQLFKQKGVKVIDVHNGTNFISDLVRFFARRMSY